MHMAGIGWRLSLDSGTAPLGCANGSTTFYARRYVDANRRQSTQTHSLSLMVGFIQPPHCPKQGIHARRRMQTHAKALTPSHTAGKFDHSTARTCVTVCFASTAVLFCLCVYWRTDAPFLYSWLSRVRLMPCAELSLDAATSAKQNYPPHRPAYTGSHPPK